MDIARSSTEAIYGGHISGRRLRGVKVNPIFEENDVTRLGGGDGGDTQSEGGVPVGEIQIEMYESLPRHAAVRHCRSAPVVTTNGHAEGREGAATPHARQAPDRGVSRRDSEKGNPTPGRTTASAGSQKRQLTRQRRYAPDDPDAIELADTPVSTPTSSSPSSSFYSRSKNNEVSSRPASKRPLDQRHQLSTVSERTNSVDSFEGQMSRTSTYKDLNALTSHSHDPAQARETAGRPSVTSLDLMNNNEMSMPDRMLQHYGGDAPARMRALRVDELGNEGYAEENSGTLAPLRPEDVIFCDTLSLRALFSLSNSSSADSDYKAFETKLSSRMNCACNGRPTLKCECGRAALQKLFRENRSGCEIGSADENAQVLDAARLLKHRLYSGDGTQYDNHVTQRPGLRRKLMALHALGQAEGKFVTFSEDTIFNEENRVTYVKECITRSAFHFPSDDSEAGYDNVGYDGFLTDDEKALQKTGADKSTSCNNGYPQSSVVFSVSSLNAPAFLHAYLMGFHQDKEVDSTVAPSTEVRAAPVSIEAIGGITSDDPAFDMIGEAAEEDFEYYRRRRRKKKTSSYSEDGSVEAWTKRTSRCRKIKVSVIVVSVIIGIVAAIGLAIHFGAPSAGNTTLTSEQSKDSATGFSRILI